jgi:putative tryptophan/tyrosine transport system substrate-binding protein
VARSGGNVTGLSQMTSQLVGKRLDLLKDMVPKLSRVAVFWNPQSPSGQLAWKKLQLAGRQLGVNLQSLEVGNTRHQVMETAAKLYSSSVSPYQS